MYGGPPALATQRPWVPGLSLDSMETVTQCYLDAWLNLSYLPFLYAPHFPTPLPGSDWLAFFSKKGPRWAGCASELSSKRELVNAESLEQGLHSAHGKCRMGAFIIMKRGWEVQGLGVKSD